MYNTEDLFNKAKAAIEENNLMFIEDIVAYLPCGKSAFYEHFPTESDNYKKLYDLLEINRIHTKVKMRKNWEKSEQSTLQLALMKMICTDEERKKLSMQYTEEKITINEPIIIDWSSEKETKQ